MMRREFPATRLQLAALALVVCFSLPLARIDVEKARRASRKLPKIELALSGPTSMRPSESLAAQRFVVKLTNRSADLLVLVVREGRLLNVSWNWNVTDAKGWPVGIEFHPTGGFCGTPPYTAEAYAARHRLHDSEVQVLAPGESRDFAIPGGPSYDYLFPTKGTYRLTVMLNYVPPNATQYVDERGKRVEVPHTRTWFDTAGFDEWDLSELSPDVLRTLQDSLPVQATSNTWSMWLPATRRTGL